ncbi:hypothetical protein L7F22_022795 [Adiantum nelumboides]|nr:hypothetical protein [Adiantum nelumboides]
METPSWFSHFMRTMYFGACQCTQHTRCREEKYFCVDCANGPFCIVKIKTEHRNHTTLQVRKCTRLDSIKVEDLRGLIDVDDVQVYIFNNAPLVYLHRRPQDQPYPHTIEHVDIFSHDQHARRSLVCLRCPRVLLNERYLYCCIECKFFANYDIQVQPFQVLRRRPRKGIPRRSPMF